VKKRQTKIYKQKKGKPGPRADKKNEESAVEGSRHTVTRDKRKNKGWKGKDWTANHRRRVLQVGMGGGGVWAGDHGPIKITRSRGRFGVGDCGVDRGGNYKQVGCTWQGIVAESISHGPLRFGKVHCIC